MEKHLRKLNSTCFDAAVAPALLVVGGLSVALCVGVILLIALAVWLIKRSRGKK